MKAWPLALSVVLLAAPGAAHEKRTDRCGCHHQFGLRHCHPKKKTPKCEAPVKASEAPEKKKKEKGDRLLF